MVKQNFLDISTPFGSKAAPANFDDLGETLVNIAKTKSNTEDKWVHRQLDDVPVVSPKNSKISENFTKCYKDLCKEINVPLAENCVNFEKAFECTTKGTVLGIEFNSENLSWRLPTDKLNETLELLDEFLGKNMCTLLSFQKLVFADYNFHPNNSS